MTLPGFPGTLNEQQRSVLQQLKDRIIQEDNEKGTRHWKDVQEEQVDADAYLLRVLRATMKGKKKETGRVFQLAPAFERFLSIRAFINKYETKADAEEDMKRANEASIEKCSKMFSRYYFKDKKLKKLVLITRTGEFGSTVDVDGATKDEWYVQVASAS